MTARTTPPHDLSTLDAHLKRIHQQLVRQNSFTLSFLRGVMTGLGASVGVTVVLGIVIFVLSQIARALGAEALFQQFITPLTQ